MDLAQGHVDALAALPRDEIYASVGNKGKYKAYNLGKGKGMSVLEMVAAMEKASGFKYKVEIVGRRFVLLLSFSLPPFPPVRSLTRKATIQQR
jgi:UDP-glucose 4-epimerase